MAPRPSLPTSFSELINIAPSPTTHHIASPSSLAIFTDPPSPPLTTLSTLIHPWDTCATTITILAPSSSIDFGASVTPTPRVFTCPATVTWTADAALFTSSADASATLVPDSTAGHGSEDEGFDFRNIPAWETALVAFAIIGAALVFIMVVVGVRRCRDRRARRWKGKGAVLGTHFRGVQENGIEMGRFEGQIDGVVDAKVDANETKGIANDKRDDGRGKQYLYGGQKLEARDVSDYIEGMQGRF